jgi:hypothetical protein
MIKIAFQVATPDSAQRGGIVWVDIHVHHQLASYQVSLLFNKLTTVS